MARPINLSLIEKRYRIEEDGKVWSYCSERYLATRRNNCGYVYVTLNTGLNGPVGVHRLVSARYIGVCPDGMEVNHKDGDKGNNHWTNLEYLTHAENVIKTYEMGRVNPFRGIKKGPLPAATREKMAKAKNKAVVANTGEVWESIWDCARGLGIDRKVVYNAIKYKRKLLRHDLRLQFVTP